MFSGLPAEIEKHLAELGMVVRSVLRSWLTLPDFNAKPPWNSETLGGACAPAAFLLQTGVQKLHPELRARVATGKMLETQSDEAHAFVVLTHPETNEDFVFDVTATQFNEYYENHFRDPANSHLRDGFKAVNIQPLCVDAELHWHITRDHVDPTELEWGREYQTRMDACLKSVEPKVLDWVAHNIARAKEVTSHLALAQDKIECE